MTSEETRRHRNVIRGQWDRENTKQIKLKLNVRTDRDILDFLAAKPNVQGYIKALIRNDIVRR